MAAGRRYFPDAEYARRIERARTLMADRGLDACVITAPENIYYLCGLDHQGYFAFQALIVTQEGSPVLITRAMERAIVRDTVPGVRHVGYSDGVDPLPPPQDRDTDYVLGARAADGEVTGVRPWSMSLGVSVRRQGVELKDPSAAARETTQVIRDAGLESARLGIEKTSSFLPFRMAEEIVTDLDGAEWIDASGLVDDCRMIQSQLELACTREAAQISDSMMLSAIAAAGPGVYKRDVMAAIYHCMFQRGGTYPGFIPLVRSTRTLEHEHGTWDEARLGQRDILFLEMAGCVRRYHAPLGRLIFIGRAPKRAEKVQRICREAIERVAETIRPGVPAAEVYRAWQDRLDRAGLSHYRRHHCGYAVGIGYPPSWSGNGVPVGLREGSNMELKSGMVFHLMSWLLRTGQGDYFISDTAVVTDKGCEVLTKVPRDLTVR